MEPAGAVAGRPPTILRLDDRRDLQHLIGDRDRLGVGLEVGVEPVVRHDGQQCVEGGAGKVANNNTLPLADGKYARRNSPLASAPSFVATLCTVEEPMGASHADASSKLMTPRDASGLMGAGLPKPGMSLPRLNTFSIARLGEPS